MGKRIRRFLWRIRLRRLWGPRSTWTGNNAHDVTATDRPDAPLASRWFAEGWSTCRCGKEFHVQAVGHTEDLARGFVHMRGSLCRACSALVARHTGRCPDGNCTLPYRHRGRCRPVEIPAELYEKARQRSHDWAAANPNWRDEAAARFSATIESERANE